MLESYATKDFFASQNQKGFQLYKLYDLYKFIRMVALVIHRLWTIMPLQRQLAQILKPLLDLTDIISIHLTSAFKLTQVGFHK